MLLLFHAARRRFVNHSPKDAELLHCVDESVKIDWLNHIRVHTELVTCHQIAFFVRRRKDDDGNHLEFFIGSDSLEHSFLALTGATIRDESATSVDQMRQFAKMWRRQR